MFQGCTSLITAPELPATTLSDYCYDDMFYGCSSLTSAPELPATTLAEYCYDSMFSGCESLTTAPELPATTLADGCYNSMFQDCTSLTTAPVLPATTLTGNCYFNMFCYCTKLKYIKMLATNVSASYCLTYWTKGVSSTGTFVKHPDMNSLPTGTSGIPSGWTVVDDVRLEFPMYLNFDYCEPQTFGMIYCYRSPDDLSLKLYNSLIELLQTYGEDDLSYITIDNITNYGFEVYIDGNLICWTGKYTGDGSAIELADKDHNYYYVINELGEISHEK